LIESILETLSGLS